MTRMTGAQAIIASLEAEGVDYLFGYPGAQAVKIFDALYDSDVHFILARHEQGAVHEADGYARASGRAGVVLVTSGPGATNTVTGIATAYMDSVPLVVITGQVPTSVIGTDSFQESDIFGITLPVVKHSYLVRDAADLATTIKEAFHIATTGRPGPVLIDVPSDVAEDMVDFAYPERVDIASYKPTVRGNQKQIRKAASLLASSQRPVILAGGGVISAEATEELEQLSSLLQIPVACTLMGKGALASDNPLNLGAIGMHGSAFAGKALHDCDVLVAIGTRFSDRVTGVADRFAPSAQLIHIDIDPAEISKIIPAAIPIVGDAKQVLVDMVAALTKRDVTPATKAWLEHIAQWKEESPIPVLEVDAASVAEGAYAINPRTVLEVLSDKLASDVVVTTDVGQHQMWANQIIARSQPRTFLTSGGLGTMGFGLPAAIGAALACPDEQVVCITGDGSIQMNVQEMATAASMGLPVKVLVLNNSVLGMVRQWQGLFLDGRYVATDLMTNPDFDALAKAYGWEAESIDEPRDVEAALDRMLAYDGPYLLNVFIDEDNFVYPMVPPGGSAAEGITTAQEAAHFTTSKHGAHATDTGSTSRARKTSKSKGGVR